MLITYEDDNGFFYQLNPEDQTAMITYEWSEDIGHGDRAFSKSYSGNIIIPSNFVNRNDGLTYTVTGVDGDAFHLCDGLTSVTIPSSVRIISTYAFLGCTNLTTLTIETGSMVEIKELAFYRCTNLSTLNIPSSVTRISSGVFNETIWYNSQPDGMVYAGNVAYSYKGTMPNGTNIIIKSGTVAISERAFYECSGLSSITIPNSVKFIGDYAFSKCTSLGSVDIPVGVTSIEDAAFYGCTSLGSVNIPVGVTSIGGYAFSGCTSLGSVDIPVGVTSIGGSAFSRCALTSITIPQSVTCIYSHAFECDNLLSVTSYITEPFNTTSFGSGKMSTPPDKIFSENTYRNGTLYVPADTKELYSRYDGWRDFLKIEEMAGQTYYLTIKDSHNGTVDLNVKLGEKYTLRISPENGRTVEYIYYNDDDVTKQLDANNCFTTPAISANSTLRVVYKGDKRGDLNGDDKVDVADHVELSEIIMNQQENE